MEEIKVGFEYFLEENGHYPSAPEIDNYKYLPSARQLRMLIYIYILVKVERQKYAYE